MSWAGWQNAYGNCVEVKHIGDDGKVFYTFYAHMRDNSLCVQKGQNIVEGQVLGVQGTTGNSTGDHLHFEIRLENKSTIEPSEYLFQKNYMNLKNYIKCGKIRVIQVLEKLIG